MTDATAVIRTDHLDGRYDGKVLTWGEGCSAGSALLDGAVQDEFELIDDDGELYYSGVLRHFNDMDAWDLLYEWGIVDSGTTLLRINGEGVIG